MDLSRPIEDRKAASEGGKRLPLRLSLLIWVVFAAAAWGLLALMLRLL